MKGFVISLFGFNSLLIQIFDSLCTGRSFICEGFLLSLSLRYCLFMRVLCLRTRFLSVKHLIQLFRIELHLKFLPFKKILFPLALLPLDLGASIWWFKKRIYIKLTGKKFILCRKQNMNDITKNQKKGDLSTKHTSIIKNSCQKKSFLRKREMELCKEVSLPSLSDYTSDWRTHRKLQ